MVEERSAHRVRFDGIHERPHRVPRMQAVFKPAEEKRKVCMTDTPSTRPQMGDELLPSKRSVAHTEHGHTSREIFGAKRCSPTYQSWTAMRSRCRLTNRQNSDRYKDRGVSVCDRWQAFENFLADMGGRPPGTTLDRFPNHAGNYEPGNCRWATPRQQARNTRKNKLTLETAIQVAVKRLSGTPYRIIAEEFGISESLPREIMKGRTWPEAVNLAQRFLEEQNG